MNKPRDHPRRWAKSACGQLLGEPAAELPGELVGTRAAGCCPQVLIDRFEVRLRIYSSYRFPGDADTADLGPHSEIQCASYFILFANFHS